MAELKKILVSLPDSLLREVDEIVAMEKRNRSEFVREAMKLYLRERRKVQIREKMKKGYQEMSKINSELAESDMGIDEKLYEAYEALLAECE
ncbi:MAG: ribbon-helix-helix protein, CopG family [Clostridia bacterium]|nr:ribbon-helix-helix protein, CopG family [Clostridia bacterium]